MIGSQCAFFFSFFLSIGLVLLVMVVKQVAVYISHTHYFVIFIHG